MLPCMLLLTALKWGCDFSTGKPPAFTGPQPAEAAVVTVCLKETGRGVTARNHTDPEGRLHNTPSSPLLSPHRSQALDTGAPSPL